MARGIRTLLTILVVGLVAAAAAVLLLEPSWSPFGVTGPEDPSGNAAGAVSDRGVAEDTGESGDDQDDGVAAASAPVDGDDTRTTMTLAGGDVSLSYPEAFGLAVNQDQLLVSSYIPVCDEGFDYCLYLGGDEYEDTNFDGAGIRVSLRDDMSYESDCMLTPPSGFSDLTPHVAGSRDHVMTRFGQVGQGAAGHFTNGTLYRLYYDGTCYEFETRIAQTQFGNYPEGTVERFNDDDAAQVRAEFRDVMASVSLPDGREDLWSGDVPDVAEPSDPAQNVHTFAPEPEELVTSPLELSGEAVGPWFFEGSFPYRLQTLDGDVLASGAVTAEGDWQTADFVDFSATIEFDIEARVRGSLVLMKDNPSGLPANDESLAIPLTMQP